MQILTPEITKGEKDKKTEELRRNIERLKEEEKKEIKYLADLRKECEENRLKEKKDTEEFIKNEIAVRNEAKKESDAIQNFRKTVLWDILRPIDVLKEEAEQILNSAKKTQHEAEQAIIRATEREVMQNEKEESLNNREKTTKEQEKEIQSRLENAKNLEKENMRINSETKRKLNEFNVMVIEKNKILEARENEMESQMKTNEDRTYRLGEEKKEFAMYEEETRAQLADQRKTLERALKNLNKK